LVVEFFGDTVEEAKQQVNILVADLQKKKFGYSWPILVEQKEQAKVWAVRKNGLGLMLGVKSARKPIAFIEDACIPMENLPEYVDLILKFCKDHEVPVAMYAHASVGLIHVRPVLNLKDQTDIDHFKAIAEYSFQLVQKYEGSISGEHGDGRVRSPFLQRYFGEQIYQAFRDVKNLFDPLGIMNPGVIVDPNPIDQDLRYGTSYKSQTIETEYHYRDMGGFAEAVEMCTGVGACRQNLAGTMCPSYRATRDEEHSTRGRANVLRLAMTGQLDQQGPSSEKVHQVMDLCLSCKSCKAECPSNVDVARLKSEFLQKYYDDHGTSLRDKLISTSTNTASKIVGWKAPFVNFVQQNILFRQILEWIAKVDKRRKLPAYAKQSFQKWFEKRQNTNGKLNKKVVLFDDTYMNFHEPNVGISAVELLESCGYEVILANAGCCQRPKISHGFLREAKKEGEKTLRNLDKFIQQGLPIVACEPGCASALTDDLPDLIDDEELGERIKNNVKMIDQFLAEEIQATHLDCEFSTKFDDILIHGHCHQKSLFGTTYMKEILDRVSGISVQEIDSGCCGMAGSFGYEKEHYDLSMKIGEQRLFHAIRNQKNGTAVIACGFSCRHQIKDGTGVQAMHWVETLRGK
jgi:Fe-S oxidoreductase